MSVRLPAPSEGARFGEVLNDAIRYWEWRRLFYNLVLAVVVLVKFAQYLPESRDALNSDGALSLLLFMLLGNAAYCAAYLPDLIMQSSDHRDTWRRHRFLLWILGTLLAAAAMNFLAIGIFDIPSLRRR